MRVRGMCDRFNPDELSGGLEEQVGDKEVKSQVEL